MRSVANILSFPKKIAFNKKNGIFLKDSPVKSRWLCDVVMSIPDTANARIAQLEDELRIAHKTIADLQQESTARGYGSPGSYLRIIVVVLRKF
jgi:hypothetical protein